MKFPGWTAAQEECPAQRHSGAGGRAAPMEGRVQGEGGLEERCAHELQAWADAG